MDEALVFATLAGALVLFVWGRPRYDVVALLALLFLVLAGVIHPLEAFEGFGHPAVVTVALVLVTGRGLYNSGAIDLVASWLGKVGTTPTAQVSGLTSAVAVLSGFMNNVGALALLMPVAVRSARATETPASLLLMPLAFASLLGGLVTLIGTPPNIILSSFRAQQTGEPFRMFDFAPVGLSIAVAGILFLSLFGWRLLPHRRGQGAAEDLFEIESYLTEARVPEKSKAIGKTIREIEERDDEEVFVVGIIRDGRHLAAPSRWEVLREGDELVLEADPEELQRFLPDVGLEPSGAEELRRELLDSDDVTVLEAVVTPASVLVRRTPRGLNLRGRYGVNVLGVSREGGRLHRRLGEIRFQPGDVLMLQGARDGLGETISSLGCLPLAPRGLRVGQPRRMIAAVAIFVASITVATLGLVPVQIAFLLAALGLGVVGAISLPDAYESIDWPIVVLLGAMIPVGMALEASGGAERISGWIETVSVGAAPIVTLAIVFVGTMFLSDLVNNTAAAVLMAPIAFGVADRLGVSADPFLMAVAVSASCAFLTPIGHQSNTLVLGPGGYRFGDYWKLGLPLEGIIAAVAIPLIPIVWPF